MRLFDPIYARDSKGKILCWEINVQEDTEQPFGAATINIHEGELEGKRTPSSVIVSKGKNIGKMNQTTPYDQAISQAESRWQKKKKQGYKSLSDLGISLLSDLDTALPFDRTDANGISKPMKAQPYFKDNGDVRIKFPCYGQPKLNGFRVMARWETVEIGEGLFKRKTEKVIFRSKEGLVYDVLEHIEAEFTKEMFHPDEELAPLVYDGEMYIPGEILSEISSAVRKRNPKTTKLEFHIFDVAIKDASQYARIQAINDLARYIHESGRRTIKVVETIHITDNLQAQRFTDECIKNGYEGGIFRDTKATYQFGKRPQTMTKLKRSQDKEFKVINVIGGENTPELGVFVCLAENGMEFNCTPEGTKEQKMEYLTNKVNYIGKMLTVRFFERTKDGKPFHAVGVTIRDYE